MVSVVVFIFGTV